MPKYKVELEKTNGTFLGAITVEAVSIVEAKAKVLEQIKFSFYEAKEE